MAIHEQRRERLALVAYGSETGNAQDYADELDRMAQRLRFSTQLSPLNAIEPSTLSEYSVIIIVLSTAGQGELPVNARAFWKSLLRKKLPSTYLEQVLFATIGLGDSSYPNGFNWAVRKLQKRLLQLGATEIYPCGEADEQHPEGLDASFVPWSTELRQHLLRGFPLDLGISPIADDVLLEPKWRLTLVDDSLSDAGSKNHVAHLPPDAQRSTTSPVISSKFCSTENVNPETRSLVITLNSNRRITPDEHWQDVRHLAFSSHTSASYGPGDVLTIYPKNFAEDVDHLISTMQWTDVADKPIHCSPVGSISASNSDPPALSGYMLSHCTTLRSQLTDRLDFTAVPRRSFFATIAHFTQDQMQKDRLLEFTQPEYIDELYDYTTRPRRSILEVLQEFESVHIPWQWAMDVLPELRGRQFSIASGGNLKYDADKGTRFELLVAIVKYKTVIKKIRQGVCTRYLADLPLGTPIQVSLQKGGLGVLEKEAKRPVIMVGPGTGLAPLRSLIWERFQWETQENSKAIALNSDGRGPHEEKTAKSILFFGCRRSDADYFFNDEWATLKRKMALQVFTAFSRDQTRKIYVQDLIKEQSDLVFRLVHQSGGIVYVCGSSGKMPQGVRASLIEVFKVRGAMTQAGAEEYLQGMEKEGRYRQETW